MRFEFSRVAVVLMTSLAGASSAQHQPDNSLWLHGVTRDFRELEQSNIPINFVSNNGDCAQDVDRRAGFDDTGNLRVGCADDTGAVRWTTSGERLIGVSFYAEFNGSTVRYEVTGARPHDLSGALGLNPPKLWEYKVRWSHANGSQGGDLCTSPESSGYAYAVPYAFSGGGELLANSKFFSFACTPATVIDNLPWEHGGGAIAKCLDWGYAPPWHYSSLSSTRREKDDLEKYRACLLMATADYCGEGQSNTFDGTPIEMWDKEARVRLDPAMRAALIKQGLISADTSKDSSPLTGVPITQFKQLLPRWPGLQGAAAPKQGSTPRFKEVVTNDPGPCSYDIANQQPSPSCPMFEAAWGQNKDASGKPIGRTKALCVSTKRYNQLITEGTCLVPDSRMPRCEEGGKSYQDWIKAGAVLFSYSTFADLRLVLFQNKKTHQYLTTAKVVADKNSPKFAQRYQVDCGSSGINCEALKSTADDWQQIEVEGPISSVQSSKNTVELISYILANGDEREELTTTQQKLTQMGRLHDVIQQVREGYAQDIEAHEGPGGQDLSRCTDPNAKPLQLVSPKGVKPQPGMFHATTNVTESETTLLATKFACLQDIGRPEHPRCEADAKKPAGMPPAPVAANIH